MAQKSEIIGIEDEESSPQKHQQQPQQSRGGTGNKARRRKVDNDGEDEVSVGNLENSNVKNRNDVNRSDNVSEANSVQKKKDDDSNDQKENDGTDNNDENKVNQNKISDDEMCRLNYYRWTFFFFFFQFFHFIVNTNIINEFSVYLEQDEVYDTFVKQYPNILPSINTQLVFNIFVLIWMVVAFLMTFRRTEKIFTIILGVFVFFFLGKVITLFISISIEKDMNKEFSEAYEEIVSDTKNKHCGPSDYSRCRMVYAWNFFKYQSIFDSVVTTIFFAGYIYNLRKYKKLLIQKLFAGQASFQQIPEDSNAQSNIKLNQQSDQNIQQEGDLNDVNRNEVSQIQ